MTMSGLGGAGARVATLVSRLLLVPFLALRPAERVSFHWHD